MISISEQDQRIAFLKKPEESTGYLNEVLEGSDIRVFLVVHRNVVQAQGGMAKLAEKVRSGRSRTSLYKTLSENGNPYLKNTNEILSVMGMHLAVVASQRKVRRARS